MSRYLCPRGDFESDHEGWCPNDRSELQESYFRCLGCGREALRGGVCPSCGSLLRAE